jgi:hypothetical protein
VWLLAIAANLLAGGQFLDVAVRDVEMAIAAYTLARLTEAHAAALSTTASTPEQPQAPRRVGTAA